MEHLGYIIPVFSWVRIIWTSGSLEVPNPWCGCSAVKTRSSSRTSAFSEKSGTLRKLWLNMVNYGYGLWCVYIYICTYLSIYIYMYIKIECDFMGWLWDIPSRNPLWRFFVDITNQAMAYFSDTFRLWMRNPAPLGKWMGNGNWLMVWTPLKNDGVRQLGWFFPLDGKKKNNVPNRQPGNYKPL